VRARIAIIGAGVVGLAIAERLSRRHQGIVVLEANAKAGQVTTARNSQVLHAGLYYPTDSLKARLCVKGNASLAAWCEAHDVRLRRVGKLIVATSQDERPELARLLAQGRANGVPLEPVEADFIAAREPNIRAVAGLWSPTTGVLDVHGLVRSLEGVARDRGVTLATRHRVTSLEPGWRLGVTGPEGEPFTLEADLVINAAGLHADHIATLAGVDVDALGLRQHWVKGRYVRVKPRRALHHLVYPVPAPTLAGLGVHITLDVDGEVRLGPDVVPGVLRVEDYDVDDTCLPQFLEAGRRLLPWLELGDLTPDTAGLRPKLSPAGGPWRDFSVSTPRDGFLCLAGIESPGLTCCLELAEIVEDSIFAAG
jgi:L-2-hydroxyglutarate oxidase LhgO